MAGKNKSLRWTRLYAGGYDLSGDARVFSSLDNQFEDADLTGWSNAVRTFLAGSPREAGVRGLQVLMNDAAAQGFAVLKDAGSAIGLVIAFGGGAEPAVADPVYMLPGIQLGAEISLDGNVPVLAGDFLPYADLATIASVGNPLGNLLYPSTSIAATTNGTSVDNGASSANGGTGIMMVLATAAGNWALKIQHSTDDAIWSDLITFVSSGGAITAETQAVTGTINRYLRFQATRTAGTTTFLAAFARN